MEKKSDARMMNAFYDRGAAEITERHALEKNWELYESARIRMDAIEKRIKEKQIEERRQRNRLAWVHRSDKYMTCGLTSLARAISYLAKEGIEAYTSDIEDNAVCEKLIVTYDL